jgi:hypothetical protein
MCRAIGRWRCCQGRFLRAGLHMFERVWALSVRTKERERGGAGREGGREGEMEGGGERDICHSSMLRQA